MNLDDLKLEILSRVPEKDHYTAHWIIDYLNTQGRIVPDGYVAVPLDPTPKQLDAAVAFALNVTLRKEYGWTNYTKDLYKIMISATTFPTTGTQAFLNECKHAAAQKVGG